MFKMLQKKKKILMTVVKKLCVHISRTRVAQKPHHFFGTLVIVIRVPLKWEGTNEKMVQSDRFFWKQMSFSKETMPCSTFFTLPVWFQ